MGGRGPRRRGGSPPDPARRATRSQWSAACYQLGNLHRPARFLAGRHPHALRPDGARRCSSGLAVAVERVRRPFVGRRFGAAGAHHHHDARCARPHAPSPCPRRGRASSRHHPRPAGTTRPRRDDRTAHHHRQGARPDGRRHRQQWRRPAPRAPPGGERLVPDRRLQPFLRLRDLDRGGRSSPMRPPPRRHCRDWLRFGIATADAVAVVAAFRDTLYNDMGGIAALDRRRRRAQARPRDPQRLDQDRGGADRRLPRHLRARAGRPARAPGPQRRHARPPRRRLWRRRRRPRLHRAPDGGELPVDRVLEPRLGRRPPRAARPGRGPAHRRRRRAADRGMRRDRAHPAGRADGFARWRASTPPRCATSACPSRLCIS